MIAHIALNKDDIGGGDMGTKSVTNAIAETCENLMPEL